MFILGMLAFISYVDYKERRIPSVCIWGLYLYGIGKSVLHRSALLSTGMVWDILFAAVITVGCLVCRCVWKGSIGSGDVRLLLVMALLVGYEKMLGILFLTFLCFFVWSVILLMRGFSKNTTLPFAPFLFAGYAGCWGISCF